MEQANVKFLSYNLYCLPWLATAFAPSACPLASERSRAFLKHIHDYDIIALQECWDPNYKTVEKYAKANGMYVVGSSSPTTGRYFSLRVFGGGLMIMSKYPIVASSECIYDKGTKSDRFVSKGVLYAKIKVDGSYVHVFNTHMQASYGYEFDFETNPYIPMRQKQLKKMTAFIQKTTANDNYPIFIMGDFNVNARLSPTDGGDSKEYSEMIELLKSKSYEVIDVLKEQNGGSHPITYGGQGVLPGSKSVGGQRLDFLLELKKDTSKHNIKYSMNEAKVVKFQVTGQKYTHISDHWAQSVVMTISGEGLRDIGASANPLASVSIVLGA